jgi:hypothetical protein
MSDPFARLNKSIFARLGGGAFLRGAEPCSVEISYGVAVNTGNEYGAITASRTVVTVDHTGIVPPKLGDSVILDGKSFTLDSLLKDDGYSSQWVVIQALP